MTDDRREELVKAKEVTPQDKMRCWTNYSNGPLVMPLPSATSSNPGLKPVSYRGPIPRWLYKLKLYDLVSCSQF